MSKVGTPINEKQSAAALDEVQKKAASVTEADEQTVVRETQAKIDEVVRRTKRHLPGVTAMLSQVRTLFRMLRTPDYALSLGTKGIIVASLLYFIVPTDVLPDFIPLVGYVDDAFVIATIVGSLRKEIERFLDWELGTDTRK